ncbi:Biosynthetic arginine decarboxylase [compost metagenome]
MREGGRLSYEGVEEHDTIEDMLRYVHLSPEEILNCYEAKARTAGLSAEERSSYFAEFCRGLKQSSYLNV